MKKTITIKSSRDFSRTFHRGKSNANKYLVIFIIKNNLNINKIGISIGKKVGNSVNRNRIKRLIRESYRVLENKLKTGYDIVFVPRQPSKTADYKDIFDSLSKIFHKLNLFNKK